MIGNVLENTDSFKNAFQRVLQIIFKFRFDFPRDKTKEINIYAGFYINIIFHCSKKKLVNFFGDLGSKKVKFRVIEYKIFQKNYRQRFVRWQLALKQYILQIIYVESDSDCEWEDDLEDDDGNIFDVFNIENDK